MEQSMFRASMLSEEQIIYGCWTYMLISWPFTFSFCQECYKDLCRAMHKTCAPLMRHHNAMTLSMFHAPQCNPRRPR
eukprot:232786-Pleurochrysis_carterae.AAC.1